MVRPPALALLAPLFLVAACTRSPSPPPEAAAPSRAFAAELAAAPARAAAAGTGRFELVVTRARSGGRTVIRTTGAYDHAAGRTEQVTTFEAELDGVADWDPAVPAGFDEGLSVRTDGDTAYVKAPVLAEALGTSDWLAAPGGADRLLRLADARALDGLGFLDVVRALHGDIEPQGRARVRGVATTRLQAAVDLREAALHLLTSVPELGVVPIEVWIDDHGLVRRLVLDADGGATATLELYDYGAPLDIELPPPDEVTALEPPRPEADP